MSGSDLPARLAARIARDGPLRFDAFQEAALYDPKGGYYERPGRVGRTGDFVTGASWHPAFARALRRVAKRLGEALGGPVDLVDVGAGEGELLRFLADEATPGDGVSLRGVETSSVRRAAAVRRVPEALFAPSAEELPRLRGLVVGYELIDALPVRALRILPDGEVAERHVSLGPDGRFVFVETPCADGEALLAPLRARGATFEEGQLLEVRPGAPALARTLAGRLEAGLLLLFDYGAPTRALYGPARRRGTLEAFRAHEVTRDVVSEPGSRDLTAWVDFGELEEELRSAGMTVHGLVSQSRFLAASGVADELAAAAEAARSSAAAAAERNALAKLIAPGGMGESLRVLVAERETGLGESLIRWPGV